LKLETWQKSVFAIALSQFVGLMGGNFVFPFLPFYIEELGIKGEGEVAFWTGLMATSTGATLFIASPFWGMLADRYGRKRMLLRAYLGGIVALALQGLAQNVWQLALLRALQGALMGTIPAATALVAASTPQRRLASSMGILQMGIFASQSTGPLLGGFLAATIGFRAAFFVTSALFTIPFFIVATTVEERFERPSPAERSAHSFTSNLRVVLQSRVLLLLMGVIFFLQAAPSFIRPIIPLLVEDFGELENPASAAGLVFAAMALTSAFSALMVGRLSARVGYRRLLVLAILGAGAAYVPVAVAGSIPTLVLLLAGVGLFSGSMVPTANALLAAFAPRDRVGSAFGVGGSAQALALAVSPLMGGITASALGIHAGFPIAGAMLLALAAATFLLVPEPRAAGTREKPRAAAEASLAEDDAPLADSQSR
jgi:DHA1 family multidrug resistance protein-like MFS transporter